MSEEVKTGDVQNTDVNIEVVSDVEHKLPAVKSKPKRFRKFAGQRNYQYETHDVNGNKISDETEEEWRERVTREWSDLDGIGLSDNAFIFHDKDVNEDGTSKGLHAHCVATFKDGKSQASACKALGCSSMQNCKPVIKSKVGAYRYLCHLTDEAMNQKKYIYDWHDVICLSANPERPLDYRDCISRYRGEKEEAERDEGLNSLLLDVAAGKATLSSVRSVYADDSLGVGWDFSQWIKYKSRYEEAEREYLEDVAQWYLSHNRCLTNIYICGEGGLGKSVLGNYLANQFADDRGIHKPASPGERTTFDFAGDYHGEAVTLFNEFVSAFPVEQFLDVFDPIHATRVNSRNNDKFWFASYGIFTTSRSLEQFLWDIWTPYAKSKIKFTRRQRAALMNADNKKWHEMYEQANSEVADKIRQLRRRFAIYVIISGGFANVYYRLDKNNVPHIFVYDEPMLGNEPFTLYQSVPFNVDDNKTIKNTAEIIKKAIVKYYEVHNFSVTPWTVEKPDLKI